MTSGPGIMPLMPDEKPDYTAFVDEPPRSNQFGSNIEQALRTASDENPGKWVRIITYTGDTAGKKASVAAGDLNGNRRGKTRKPGHWEFRSAKLPDGTGGVWARYHPENT